MRQPPTIRILPEQLANQIAAGEVVERPAAAVKELIENSLDAGATRIVVRVEMGGRRLIEIEDDGHGMFPADLRLAIGRHATSKLTNAAELFAISTLGFRGEALPSLAAVSEMELISRPHDKESGHQLSIVGGQITGDQPIGCAPGTRISVRNLFWNVPARLKFLKTESSENGHIADAVLRLALGHPRVAFRLESDGKESLDLPAAESLLDRIRQAFGKDLAAGLLPVAFQPNPTAALEITGFVAHPRDARPTTRRQFCFLNGRFIRDRVVLAALKEGCAGFMEPRLHPAVFLHLNIDPSLVDVNVHPAKAEVRFVREGEVFTLVRDGVRQALSSTQVGAFPLLTPLPTGSAAVAAPLSTLTQPSAPPPRPVVPPPPPAPSGIQERFLPQSLRVEPAAPSLTHLSSSSVSSSRESMPSTRVRESSQPFTPHSPYDGPRLPKGVRRVIQLNDAILLIETEQGLRLVDQHALHEKALFLALGPEANALGTGGRQELVVPIIIALSASETAQCIAHQETLAQIDIIFERLDPTRLALRAHPARLRRLDWTGFFTAVANDANKAVDSLRERIAHHLACRAAVKAGQILSASEQIELVDLLYRVEGLEHCPHGRPTTLDLSWSDLDRRFQR